MQKTFEKENSDCFFFVQRYKDTFLVIHNDMIAQEQGNKNTHSDCNSPSVNNQDKNVPKYDIDVKRHTDSVICSLL